MTAPQDPLKKFGIREDSVSKEQLDVIREIAAAVDKRDPTLLRKIHESPWMRNECNIMSRDIFTAVFAMLGEVEADKKEPLYTEFLNLFLLSGDHDIRGRAKHVLTRPFIWEHPNLFRQYLQTLTKLPEQERNDLNNETLDQVISKVLLATPEKRGRLQQTIDLFFQYQTAPVQPVANRGLLKWVVQLRLFDEYLKDVPPQVGAGRSSIVENAHHLLCHLLSQGADLETSISFEQGRYETALHAACSILDDSDGGTTAVSLLITEGADYRKVLDLGVGERSREAILAHPRVQSAQLHQIVEQTTAARQDKRKPAM